MILDLARSVGFGITKLRAGVFVERKSCQQVPGVYAVKGRGKRDVVFTGARRIESKLHPTAVTLCKSSIVYANLRCRHPQRRGQRAEIFSIHQKSAKRDAPVDVRRSEFSFQAAVKGELSTQIDTVASHLLFHIRQQAR